MTDQRHPAAFTDKDIAETRPEMKIGLLATVNSQGLPHLTLLSSLMACAPGQLCFGQFTEGFSKKHILDNPRTGFLIMDLDKNVWRGTADYSHSARTGAEYDHYNNVPMFRYNAYFGVHTVHYLDLVWLNGKAALPMGSIVGAAIATRMARTLAALASPGASGAAGGGPAVLNGWTRAFLDKLDNLKFLSYVGADGYPLVIPAIQTQSLDKSRALFAVSVFEEELEAIPAGVPLAVFGMALTMEAVLMRGTYRGIGRVGGVRAGVVDLDWVYNSMPPVPGQVYPPVALEPVAF